MRQAAACLLAVVLLVAGCGSATPDEHLTVFAAASLRVAIERLGVAWHAANPSSALVVSTGSSAALRAQIEQGAPADLFLSADTANPQALFDAGLTEGAVTPFATNRLVVITPPDDPGQVAAAVDLGEPGKCIVAAGAAVPITRYAEQLVRLLGIADAYEANLCSREDDVAAVVAKIELGEGDAAIVYASDALAANVRVIELPGRYVEQITAVYAGVVVKGSARRVEAQALLDWLRGSEGQQILAAAGFGPLH